MQIFGSKMQFVGPKSIFFPKSSIFFDTIMTGHQKDNFFVLTLMHGGPWGGCGGPFLAPKSAFFYATTIKPPFFQVRRTRLHGIICPPCPEVTLDNFGFPVGGRLVPRGVVFRLPGRILAFFGPKWAPTATPRPSVHQGQYKKVVFLVSSHDGVKKMDDFGKKWIKGQKTERRKNGKSAFGP